MLRAIRLALMGMMGRGIDLRSGIVAKDDPDLAIAPGRHEAGGGQEPHRDEQRERDRPAGAAC